MAHLTKPQQYDIKDSNIALLGSDLEKRVREHGGDTENAWIGAGQTPGLQVWRIEKFNVVEWPKERYGSFYDGDSYIVLHTYKKTPETKAPSFDLHFWLGDNTSLDEAGTAAYKTVELDDHLHGRPVQYREVQGFETDRFLSYFSRYVCLRGGAASGFHHVSDVPPLDIKRLYRIALSQGPPRTLVIRQVPVEIGSLVQGDVFVLDKGAAVWQLNTMKSAGAEKFKAAEFVRSLADSRQGQCDVSVFDEGSSGASIFLSELGDNIMSLPQTDESRNQPEMPAPKLYRLSDSSGKATFSPVANLAMSSLHSADAFLLSNADDLLHPAVYVWLGKGASLNERRLVVEYAQLFLHDHCRGNQVSVPLVKMNEGDEVAGFVNAFN